jgi:pyruvate/2-oxoglutarate dehydrogenase complex dihydrolipoamide dehydrogenase (E3) component
MELLDIRMALGDGVTACGRRPTRCALDLKSGATVEVDAVLVAAGRLGNTAGLGLERLGIRSRTAGTSG